MRRGPPWNFTLEPVNTNEFVTIASVNDVIQQEFVNLSARNFCGSEGKRIAGEFFIEMQGHVKEVGITGLSHLIRQLLSGGRNNEHHAHVPRRCRTNGNRPPRCAIPPIKTQRYVKEDGCPIERSFESLNEPAVQCVMKDIQIG